MLFFSQFVRPTQRKLAWPFGLILSCDQHRKPAFLSELYIVMLYDRHRKLACLFWFLLLFEQHRILSFLSEFILLCDQHRKLAGLCDVTNTEYWRLLSEIILLWDQQRELACLFGVFDLYYCATNTENWHAFLISSIVRTTQNTVIFIWVYIIVRSTQKTGGPFLVWFLYYCATNTKYWHFFIWEYIIVRPTQKTSVPFWFWFILLCDQRTKLACILCVRWNWHVLARKMIVIFHILSWRPTAIWRFDNAQWQLFLSLPTKQNTDMWAIYNNWCVDNVCG